MEARLMSPLVIREVKRELKPMKLAFKSSNPYFRRLVHDIPPQAIEDKTLHAHYAKLVEKLTLILVRARKESIKDRDTRQAIEGLGQYVKMIAELVEHYEKERFTIKDDPIETLKFLMEQHGLSQTDLAKDFGGQPVVSAVLAGRRLLNKNHILKLAARFNVSPAIFFPAA
jgi:antitoxin component HigA of HigAB toxin-antitoxin module